METRSQRRRGDLLDFPSQQDLAETESGAIGGPFHQRSTSTEQLSGRVTSPREAARSPVPDRDLQQLERRCQLQEERSERMLNQMEQMMTMLQDIQRQRSSPLPLEPPERSASDRCLPQPVPWKIKQPVLRNWSNKGEVESFVLRVKSFQSAMGVSDEDCYANSHLFFEGEVYIWVAYSKLKTWAQVLEGLKQRAGIPRDDERKWKRLISHKREPREGFLEFVERILEGYGSMSTPPPLYMLLELIREQAPPHLRLPMRLARIKTIGELQEWLQDVGEIEVKTVPRGNGPGVMAGEGESPRSEQRQSNWRERPPVNNTAPRQLVCWTCQAVGHLSRNCPARTGENRVTYMGGPCRLQARKSYYNPGFKRSKNCNVKPNKRGSDRVIESRLNTEDEQIDAVSQLAAVEFIPEIKDEVMLEDRFDQGNSPVFPEVTVEIEKQIKTIGLFDSGSNANAILEEIVPRSLLSQIRPWRGVPPTTASGEKMQTNGCIELRITIDNFDFIVNFVIFTAVTPSIILGMPFLREAKITINFAENTWVAENYMKIIEGYPQVTWNEVLVDELKPDGVNNLKGEEEAFLNSLKEKHEDLFSGKIGCTAVMELHIPVKDTTPVYVRPYRQSAEDRKFLEGHIEALLKDGIIRRSWSPYCSPCLVVKKADGGRRMCIDYRKLNTLIVDDRYPMVHVESIIEIVGNACYFTKLDLNSAFYQLPICEEDIPKTAFGCFLGLFEFTRMPFGIKLGCQAFQRLMTLVLGPVLTKFCLVYIDDIILFSHSIDEHRQHLEIVCSMIERAGLSLNFSKCSFFMNELTFLGFKFTKDGIQPSMDKVQAIVEYPPPKSKRDLRSFLGACNWNKRFVPNFAMIARPLYDLLKKSSEWQWTDDCQQSFEQLKTSLVEAPALSRVIPGHTFVLYTDASKEGVAAHLAQEDSSGEQRSIAYLSRRLSRAEANYAVVDLELLAVVWALRKLRALLLGVHFRIISDHQPLRYLLTARNLEGRLARWALILQGYSFTVQYRKGRLNVVADFLSRYAINNQEREESVPILCFRAIKNDLPDVKNLFEPWNREEWIEKQKQDTFCKSIFEKLASGADVPFVIKDGLLIHLSGRLTRATALSSTKRERIVLPMVLTMEILRKFHDAPTAGHYGMKKTWARISSRFYAPTLREDVKNYVRGCLVCQRVKTPPGKKLGQLCSNFATRPGEVIATDIFGPLVPSKKLSRYILAFIDLFSRWVWLHPLRVASAQVVAARLRALVLTFGAPGIIVSDNAKNFVNRLIVQVCAELKIHHRKLPAYHPESNRSERIFRDLKFMLTAYLIDSPHTAWEDHLQEINYAMNSAVNLTTGLSPAMLFMGREILLPFEMTINVTDMKVCEYYEEFVAKQMELLEDNTLLVKERQERRHDQNKKRFDQTHLDKDFKVGDLVMRREFPLSNFDKRVMAKLLPKWSGPYVIKKRINPVVYVLELNGKDLGTRHLSHLKKYEPPTIVQTDGTLH